MNDELPLPEPDLTRDRGDDRFYHANTVRGLIAAAVAQERERCAKVCDDIVGTYDDNRGLGAGCCADAIRSGAQK